MNFSHANAAGIPPTRLFMLHWNRPEVCVRSVQAAMAQGIRLSICVIDNGSAPDELRRLKVGLPPDVELVVHPRNLGWGAAFNAVLAPWLISTETCCFISAHDALPEPGCFSQLCQAMEAHQNVGLLCPEYGDGARVRFSAFRGIWVEHVADGTPGTVEVMPAPHGTLVLVRRKCLAEIGLFDERYFAYGDETEIGLRAARKGWQSAMLWGAVVKNPGSWTPKPIISYLHARNTLLTIHIYSGLFWAYVRILLKMPLAFRDQYGAGGGWSLVHARLLGVFDFLRQRFGAPRADLFSR